MDQSEGRIFTFHSDENRALLVTSLMGKAVCKRRPFATMTKYILLTCFVVFVLYPLILIIKGTEGKQ